ncbi:MAG TPA: ZIP family metal transporter [Candidatus Dorea intestinavium]|nr:ZIP family metal transporter [Candidatus Dorea intestinavium]
MKIIIGILIPFLGTTLGAACVFFMRDQFRPRVQKALLGFASGVMVAASVWSLLIPAMEMSADKGRLSFMPAAIGFLLGVLFLLTLDHVTPHLHLGSDKPEGPSKQVKKLKKNTMMVFAVTLHNIPEGMAIGVVFAGLIAGNGNVTMAGAYALTIGIAIQNFPEGAIISMPLKSDNGLSKKKAFLYGTGSGIVEPIAALLTIAVTRAIQSVLPYLLAFAAGAMIYVVVEELVPEASQGEHSNIGTIGFAVGFTIMMILDVALG